MKPTRESLLALLALLVSSIRISTGAVLSTSHNEVTEDIGTVNVSVTSIYPTDREAFISIVVHFHDDAVPGIDYELEGINLSSQSFSFSLAAGATRTFQMTIIDDNVTEFYRKDIHLQSGVFELGFPRIVSRRTVHLNDDDGLHFNIPTLRVDTNEADAETYEFCLLYSQAKGMPSSLTALIRVSPISDDIVFSDDRVPFNLTIGESQCYNVSIVDDDENESLEYIYFSSHLLNTTSGTETITDVFVIAVQDDEPIAYFEFEDSFMEVVEGNGVVIVCVTTEGGDGSERVRVSFTNNPITTEGAADHALRHSFTMVVGERRACTNITIVSDDEVEGTESFRIRMSLSALNGNPKISSLFNEATIIIYDDDYFPSPDACNPECVNGKCQQSLTCLCDDGYIGKDCSQKVCELSCVHGECNGTTGLCHCTAGFTGPSCDRAICSNVWCSSVRGNRSEANKRLSFSVTSLNNGTLDGYFSLEHRNIYRYANVGEDFVLSNITLSSPVVNFSLPPFSSETLTGSVIDDSIAEYIEEYFFLHVGVYDRGVGFQCCSYISYIHDNDGLQFERSMRSITVPEHVGTVELCVIHYGGDNVPSVINATYVLTNYAENDDITFNATTFSVAAGNRTCFNVSVIDDNRLDFHNQGFTFYIDSVNEALRNRDYYDYTSIFVRDNEVFRYGLEKSSYTVMESDGVVTVCAVVYETNVTDVFTADISTGSFYYPGSTHNARSGVDFMAINQLVNLSQTLNKSCVSITVVDDDIPEQYEVFPVYSYWIRNSATRTILHQSQRSTSIVIVVDSDYNLTCTPECVNGECVFATQCGRGECTPGVCQCFPGWTSGDCSALIGTCDDDNGECDQICTDYPGGYNCSCRDGYRSNGTSCEEICQPHCVNGTCNATTKLCDCSPGYTGVSCNEVVVPPLVVKFIKDSPRVQGDSLEADILLSRPVQSLVCRLKGGSFLSEKDCQSRHVSFTGLSPALYTLRVIARSDKNEKIFIKTHLEITNDTSHCTLHLINDGVSVEEDSATVEFTGRGPVSDYSCQLDKMEFFQCSSPVELTGLSSGGHVLKIVPIGCGRNRMNLKTDFIV